MAPGCGRPLRGYMTMIHIITLAIRTKVKIDEVMTKERELTGAAKEKVANRGSGDLGEKKDNCRAKESGHLEGFKGNVLRGDASLRKLAQLEEFSNYIRSRAYAVDGRRASGAGSEDGDGDGENCCYICYACDSDALFEPCHHRLCLVTRHLLNSPRCFFCNTIVINVVMINRKGCELERCSWRRPQIHSTPAAQGKSVMGLEV